MSKYGLSRDNVLEQLIQVEQKWIAPRKRFVVVGGAAMTLHGIRNCDDIDVLAHSSTHDRIPWQTRYSDRTGALLWEPSETVDVLRFLDGIDPVAAFREVVSIEGFLVQNYLSLIVMKTAAGRWKDCRDIELLHRHLRRMKTEAGGSLEHILR